MNTCRSDSLHAFLNATARSIFSLTIDEAHNANVCICCRHPIETLELTQLDAFEYNHSGLCPKCSTF